jgi:hypothetical protein
LQPILNYPPFPYAVPFEVVPLTVVDNSDGKRRGEKPAKIDIISLNE